MLIDLIKANRSYRGYDHNRAVTKDELLHLVEAARLCPSSVNMQPLRYFLAYDPTTVATIQVETKWAKGLADLTLPHSGKEPTAFIVICQDTNIDANLSRFQRDVGIVAQTMLLTAVEMGLGGCMIGNFNAGSVHDVLGLKEEILPLLIVAIGKPDETIILTDVVDGKTGYYRDEQDRHYVPKRALSDIVIDPINLSALEKQFHQEMLGIYIAAKAECGYTATRFLQLVSSVGGLAAAKQLITKPGGTEGFARLYECGRLDLSVEAHVLQQKYTALFSEQERKICQNRLKEYKYV